MRLPGTYPAQGDTRLLAETLRRRDLATGRRVLDVGTGGGALALAAAKAGAAAVTAVDLSLRSVMTARLNSRLNRAPITVRQGDLFAPVRGERFGLVLANPPYVPAASDELPRHRQGRCWDAGRDGRAVLDRICADVGDVLAEDGVLLLTHSALADERLTVERLKQAGLEASVVQRALEPFGPVMRKRADMLAARGLVEPGQQHEELVVIEARRPALVEVDVRRPAGAEAAAGAERAA
ncbi:HemK2/MTQ2 family protein methyltransferase [Motilibacter deserti]|uniref:Methyltransferase n=1 Tax=Motilibacter deserti TaxID=2714956 RepID=A0ABX0GTT2_9ACTN|nr:methyltransferase [Motilibacter deserti]